MLAMKWDPERPRMHPDVEDFIFRWLEASEVTGERLSVEAGKLVIEELQRIPGPDFCIQGRGVSINVVRLNDMAWSIHPWPPDWRKPITPSIIVRPAPNRVAP